MGKHKDKTFCEELTGVPETTGRENPPADNGVESITPVKLPILTGMLSDYKNLPIVPNSSPMCTWPLDTIAGRARLHQCINAAGSALWDMCEKGPYQFLVENLAVNFTSWEPEDRPGEIVEGPMFYLVGPTEILHSGSDGVYLSLQQLALLEGQPPWDPPVVLRAERAPTRNRRMRLALSFIGRG